MADRDLRETEVSRDLRQPHLMIGVAPAVHEDDRQRVNSVRANRPQSCSCLILVDRAQDLAINADPLVDLDDAFIEHRWQHDVPREDVGPRLVADPQRIAEPPGHRQRDPFALAFEQGVGCDRGAHPHLGDLADLVGQDTPDRLQRRILVATGVVGQQLLDPHAPVGRACDDVGERPAAVDREGP